jgi:hypothetical protein
VCKWSLYCEHNIPYKYLYSAGERTQIITDVDVLQNLLMAGREFVILMGGWLVLDCCIVSHIW